MEDIFAAIVWIGVIISGIIKFINKHSSDEKGKQNVSEIEKKIKGFFEENIGQESNHDRHVSSRQNSKSEYNSEEEWVPVYEEKPETQRINSQVEKKTIDLNKNKIGDKKKFNVDSEMIITAGSIGNKRRNNEIINKRKEKNIRNKSSKPFVSGDFTDIDLLKGVIFKEILDEPRAVNPYRPINKK